VVASTEFIGPRQGADEPAKSKSRLSPAFATVSAILSGSLTTPSESTKASDR
jgi:hypothetical protein